MQNGVVLVYSKDGSSGVIRTPDGKRLFFNRKQMDVGHAAVRGTKCPFQKRSAR